MKKFAIIFFSLIVLAGCAKTAPILNVENHSVVEGMSTSTIEQCIFKAGEIIGWKMVSEGPGVIEAAISVRGHIATVNITYTEQSYSITYKSSSAGLRADKAKGIIHKSYNRWIERLDGEIGQQIINAKYAGK